MALTRSYKDTIKARAERDPAFRDALLAETLDTAIARGIADADAGRVKPAGEIGKRLNAKYESDRT